MLHLLLQIIYLAFISLGLPDSLLGREYYHPTDEGVEWKIKARLAEIKAWKKQHEE